ncbi:MULTISPECIES: glycosyltransferase family protein [Thermoactinomyces]|jgi:hypothetical protein|uniref:Streptomycin biosynthesis protein StrF n=1 Tax=Thermoactinomyces daqus TaxID=1329516 RepID=A0A7W1XDA9_9BACL|nr:MULTISPECIES: glycosyltransferase family protein [Thermoactinomyces]MBA4544511.1 streptomycin biosynthesis protein StrF [Thermoactinomyces daqus]MBH8599666.1 glycosyltransferase family protein [Thermoactinomyces sp. CICC 10523]MBH8605678.1 glycosyltransferase family protein [Thermoactinomyces sp. CICC 10522]
MNNKFLFVTCVNDETLYALCVKHIQNLDVPQGYTIELFPVYGAKGMAEGYNRALANDAKYKIYLHQDTFIINPHFLREILTLFQNNPLLGLLGFAGCKTLPSSGFWWEGKELYGKLIGFPGNTYKLEKWKEVTDAFEAVEAVDGFLMVTQYDVPWRADLFDGFDFYDISQSLEFKKHGFLVGVPKQIEPWSLHYHTNFNNHFDYPKYMHYHEIFARHYLK